MCTYVCVNVCNVRGGVVEKTSSTIFGLRGIAGCGQAHSDPGNSCKCCRRKVARACFHGIHKVFVLVCDSSVAFLMSEKIEQPNCIRFFEKRSDSCRDTYSKLQRAYGEEFLSCVRVYDW